jgi:hypothetical protein
MWRGWFLHNDAIFGSGKETITSSVMFMVNYNATLRRLSLKENKGADEKGKAPLDSYLQEDQTGKPRSQSRRDKEGWKPSKTECVKLNTDAGFCWDSGCASASIVVRDHTALSCSLHGRLFGDVGHRRKLKWRPVCKALAWSRSGSSNLR